MGEAKLCNIKGTNIHYVKHDESHSVFGVTCAAGK